MKKIIAILFCSLFITAVYAQNQGNAGEPVQDDGFKKFKFGVTVYPSIGWTKPNEKDFENEGSNFGFGYGFSAEIGISTNYTFLTGAELQTIGGKISYPNYIEDDGSYYKGKTTADLRLGYVNIPLQLKLKTNQIGYMTYFANIGFDLGIKYKAKADYTTEYDKNSKENTSNKDINISKETGLLRAGLVFGIGAEYNISGSTSIVIGASFHNGFINFIGKKWPNYETDKKGKVLLSNTEHMPNSTDPKAIEKSGKASAITNYLALNIGIIF